MKPEILIISTMYPNSKVYLSGIFVHEQVKALKDLSYKITVIAPIPISPWILALFVRKWRLYREIPEFEIIENVNVYHPRYYAFPFGFLKQFWSYYLVNSIMRLINEKKIRYDLIHAHGSLPDDHTAFLLSKRTKKPYIITVHGETVFSLLRSPRKFSKSKLSIENAQAVIGVSSLVVERIKKFTNRQSGIFKVLNGYKITSSDSFKVIENKDRLSILSAATWIERKGCEYLILAFSELVKKYNNIHLVIVGGGTLYLKMVNLTNKLGIEDKVTFTGGIKHNEVIRHIASCNIFALPSWDEAFGVVYLEAMSLKKPIIGTIGEGIEDVINNGKNGILVHPRSVSELKDKLEYLICNPEGRQRIGQNGFESIRKLTWENSAQELQDVYLKVVSLDLINSKSDN